MPSPAAVLYLVRSVADQLAELLETAEPLPAGPLAGARLHVVAADAGFGASVLVCDDDGRFGVWSPSTIAGGHPGVGDSLEIHRGQLHADKVRTFRIGTTVRALPAVERLSFTVVSPDGPGR